MPLAESPCPEIVDKVLEIENPQPPPVNRYGQRLYSEAGEILKIDIPEGQSGARAV